MRRADKLVLGVGQVFPVPTLCVAKFGLLAVNRAACDEMVNTAHAV